MNKLTNDKKESKMCTFSFFPFNLFNKFLVWPNSGATQKAVMSYLDDELAQKRSIFK